MRILIYSETDTAKALLIGLREGGHHAVLRNPHYFNAAQFDQNCEKVFADDETILAAYGAIGIEAECLHKGKIESSETVEEVASTDEAEQPEESAPKRKRR